MAYRLKLPTSFNNPDLPEFAVDPILTKGSVWLVDPAHPVRPWAVGVLSNGVAVPNIVTEHPQFAPEGLDPMPLQVTTDGLLTGSFGKVERTTKGGLHVIQSRQANGDFFTHTASKYYWAIEHNRTTATPWTNYFYGTNGSDGAYTQHDFYLSTWMNITRQQDAGANSFFVAMMNRGSHVSNGHVGHRMLTTSSHQQLPQVRDVTNGVRFNASSSNGPIGTTNMTSANNVYFQPFIGGHYFAAFNLLAGVRENAPSMVLYRSYLEDLTVSGRTFAEVSAIDQALFTRDCLTAGGRYYGDTFTDPATIP